MPALAIEGPGKGSVLTLGVGLNSIGRGDEARVPIPFSDNEISRGKAVVIAYDKKNNQYFLLPGDGKTIAYVEGNLFCRIRFCPQEATFL